MKLCPKCKESKPLSEYHMRSPNKKGVRYPSPYCKPCTLDDQRERRANGYKQPIRSTEHNTRKSWLRLLRKKGITEEVYLQMKSDQGDKCAICSATSAWGRSDKWHVDHCHTTGKVRGLLCSKCNTGLGLFSDNPEVMKIAIQYLIAHLPESQDSSEKNKA